MKKTRTKSWNATLAEESFTRENYGKLSKTQMANQFGISVKQFELFTQKRGIMPNYNQKHVQRDLTGYTRVPVPCPLGCKTFILVNPRRDPETARMKYIERTFNRAKGKELKNG